MLRQLQMQERFNREKSCAADSRGKNFLQVLTRFNFVPSIKLINKKNDTTEQYIAPPGNNETVSCPY